MTKCIVLGQEPTEVKKNPIEFHMALAVDCHFNIASAAPKQYINIELVAKGYVGSELDIMFAYDKCRNLGCLYIGKWNDGVAE